MKPCCGEAPEADGAKAGRPPAREAPHSPVRGEIRPSVLGEARSPVRGVIRTAANGRPRPHRVAISGHRGLPPHTAMLVEEAIRRRLSEHPSELRGVSCLADGADQVFARVVIELGGALEAVVCSESYREELPPDTHDEYDLLMSAAEKVHRLRYAESTDEAHMQGSLLMLGLVEELYAVWDGKPARGYGGTADVVAEARRLGIKVHVIWPEGASRE